MQWVEGITTDIRYGWRNLCRRPGFTAVAVISLAVGIGFNTAVFSVINAVFFTSLSGVRDPGRLVYVDGQHSSAAFRHLSDTTTSLSALAAWQPVQVEIRYGDSAVRRVVPAVSDNYFQVLGVRPFMGRLFEPGGGSRSDEPVVVLGQDFWSEALGGEREIIGQSLTVNGYRAQVVGIAPREFHGVERPALWITMAMKTPFRLRPATGVGASADSGWRLIGRLREGVAVASVQAELELLRARDPERFDDALQVSRFGGAWRGSAGPEKRIEFLMVVVLPLVVVGLILWVGCSNVANLLLARAVSRQREIAVRVAAGASAGRIVRLLLTESLMLAWFGGALGLLVALWTLDLAWATFPEFSSLAADLDMRVLFYTGSVCVVATLLFGLVPALHAVRVDVGPALKGDRTGAREAGGRRTRTFFLVTQFAASTALLLVAGTFARTVVSSYFGPRAAQMDHLAIAYLESRGETPEARAAFWSRVRGELAALPGVQHATILSRDSRARLTPDGAEPLQHDAPVRVQPVDPLFFSTVGATILQGSASLTDGATRLVVINERLASRFWPRARAVGQRVSIEGIGAAEVAGIVDDGNAPPAVFLPGSDESVDAAQVLIRTGPPSAALLGPLRDTFSRISPDPVAANASTLRDAQLGGLQRITRLGLIVAMVVLALATVGLYGSVSFLMSQRSREIAIRSALGAPRVAVLRLVARDGFTVVAAGSAVGLLVSALGFQFMSGMWFASWTLEPYTVAAVLTVFALTTAAACYLPGRRALRLQPMSVLRNE